MKISAFSALAIFLHLVPNLAASQTYGVPLIGDCGPKTECIEPLPRPVCPDGGLFCLIDEVPSLRPTFQSSFTVLAASTSTDDAPTVCSYDVDADPFDSCRVPVVGVVNNDLNFADGTAVIIDEEFALTARHVTNSLETDGLSCGEVSSQWSHGFFVSAEVDLLYGSSEPKKRFPVVCVIEHPDPKVDLSLLRILVHPPIDRRLRYKLLDSADTPPFSAHVPHHRSGFGLFESLVEGTCSDKPDAGHLKFGIAQETQCNPDQRCQLSLNFQLENPSIDLLDSSTCNADSGGAVTLEMDGNVETDGAVALRGILIRKPTTAAACNHGSIAVDISNNDIQEWVISEIAAELNQNADTVRARIVHQGDPTPNLSFDDFIRRANLLDDTTNQCD